MKFFWWILGILLGSSLAYAADITVYNATDGDVYAATYYHSYLKRAAGQQAGERVSTVDKPIKSKSTQAIKLPTKKLSANRRLIFSTNKESLKSKLSVDEYKVLGSTYIGSATGSKFYIDQKDGRLAGYNQAEWTIINPLKDLVEKNITGPAFDSAITRIRQAYDKSPESKEQVKVRTTTSLSSGEQNYLKARQVLVKTSLGNWGVPIKQGQKVPRIAFCCSGGGYRAMLVTLGALLGAQDMGLLDTLTYVTALSGSSWLLAPWIDKGLSLNDYKAQLIPRIGKSLFTKVLNIKKVTSTLLKKLVFGQPISLIDIYGYFLGNTLLDEPDKDHTEAVLSSQAEKVSGGSLPYPIYTAVTTRTPYEWLEFTPHEVGSNYLGGYVPTKSFGNLFKQGIMKQYAPEQRLEFFMGIWGSAISANFKEILENFSDKITLSPLKKALSFGLEETSIGGIRIVPAKVLNFASGLPNSPRSQVDVLTLIDAGVDFNFPLPPLLRKERDLDLIIIIDASEHIDNLTNLNRMIDYLKRNKFAIPKIANFKVTSPTATLFEYEKNGEGPMILYIPFALPESIKKAGYASTFNMAYKPEQANELIDFAQKLMKEKAQPVIKQALGRLIKK